MAEDDKKNTRDQPPSIIKKIRKNIAAAHHGGGWKVAYADFMTAMMAFFMLMWLLNMSSEEQKKGISNYFAPIGSSQEVTGTEGLMDGGKTLGQDGNLESMSEEMAIFPESQYFELEIDVEEATGDQKSGPNNVTQDKEPENPLNESPKNDPQQKQSLDKKESSDKTKDSINSNQKALEEAEKKETLILTQIKDGIEKTINSDPYLKQANKNILMDVSDEGLIINLIDKKPYSMFDVGSKKLQDRMKKVLQVVVKIIRKLNNPMVVTGHTDSLPYASKDGYNNWDLSTERAIMTRRFLEQEGYPSAQVHSVIGRENTDPLNKTDLAAPENRRVSLTVRRKEKSIKEEGKKDEKKP